LQVLDGSQPALRGCHRLPMMRRLTSGPESDVDALRRLLNQRAMQGHVQAQGRYQLADQDADDALAELTTEPPPQAEPKVWEVTDDQGKSL